MLNKKKKNLTILVAAILNLILTLVAISGLSKMVPINIFGENIGKMAPRTNLLIIPVALLVLSLIQIFYRIKTMELKISTFKRIEDGIFSFLDSALITFNWALIYIGYQYTQSMLINITIPTGYIVMAGVGCILVGIYSTFAINKMGTILGLRTIETLDNKEVWRIANRFNGFTGFVSGLVLIGLAMYFTVYGLNVIALIFGLFICGLLMFYVPRLNAKRAYRKIVQKQED